MPGPKKSETIEIRLPHAAKQAFMARCRDRGVSASEALRAFIDGEIAAPVRSPRLRWAAVGLAALAIGAVAAPSLARPSLPARFARLDRHLLYTIHRKPVLSMPALALRHAGSEPQVGTCSGPPRVDPIRQNCMAALQKLTQRNGPPCISRNGQSFLIRGDLRQ